MTLKNWLILEKDDLDKRIRHYSGFRFILLFSAVIGFLISFLLLGFRVNSLPMRIYDQLTIQMINRINNPALLKIFSLITNLGSDFFIGMASITLVLILIKVGRKRAAAASLATILGSATFIYLFKHLFARPRPIGCWGSDCFSYPSGHSTIATYFYGLLDYLVFRFLPMSFKVYFIISSVIILVVLLVSVSRLFLQFHYLSDIFAGFFLGGAWLLVAVLLIDILYHQV
jgi:undecaprenyl-diphosphatase